MNLVEIGTHVAAFYAGGAVVTFFAVNDTLGARILSALVWPTFPLWPG